MFVFLDGWRGDCAQLRTFRDPPPRKTERAPVLYCVPEGLTPAYSSLTCTSVAPGSLSVRWTSVDEPVGAAASNAFTCTAVYSMLDADVLDSCAEQSAVWGAGELVQCSSVCVLAQFVC